MGFSAREVALMVGINQKTIDLHRYNIFRKLELKNTAALTNFLTQIAYRNIGAQLKCFFSALEV